MKLIKFKTDKSGITIRIPKTLLNHVAKHHPECPVKVHDSNKLLQLVAQQIESELLSEDDCNSLTRFQLLIDDSISALVENGEECVELIEIS